MALHVNGTDRLWLNRADEVLRAEIGDTELAKRKELQEILFRKGSEKGNIIDLPSIVMTTSSIKSMFEEQHEKNGKQFYTAGVGANGYVTFQPSADIPPNKFFVRDKTVEVRARHASFPYAQDERKLGWRTLSVKLADHDTISPLDLELRTGDISHLFNGEAVKRFYEAAARGPEAMKSFMTSLPIYVAGSLEGLRQRPSSYQKLHYYSQLVYDFHAFDGLRRVARFRVTSTGSTEDYGKLDDDEQRDVWYKLSIESKEETNEHSATYLRDEFKERLRAGPVEYKLEIQLRDVTSSDTNAIYNPAVAWTEERHPWLRLGTITLTSPLADDVNDSTHFNVGHTPPSTLSFPEPTSVYDFNMVAALRQEIATYYGQLRAADEQLRQAKSDQAVADITKQPAKYLLHLVTGSNQDAGNSDPKCNVYVSIVGTTNRTKYVKLQRKSRSDFDRSQQASFSIRDKVIGDFVCLKVYKDRCGSQSDWFLEYAVLTVPYSGRCHTLPCYRWFTNDEPVIILRDGSACLQANERVSYLSLLRKMELGERQSTYRWHETRPGDEYHGFPGYISGGHDVSNLPRELRFTLDEKKMERVWNEYMRSAGSMLRSLSKLFRSNKRNFEEQFEDAISDVDADVQKTCTMLHIVKNWKDDKEFGRQVLNGLNPLKIVCLTDIPRTLAVTNELVDSFLLPGKSLSQELKAGKIFYFSYPELEDYVNLPDVEEESVNETPKEKTAGGASAKRYLCAPQVLLYSKEGVLLPIAIQLTPDKDPSGHTIVYTPDDNRGAISDWLLAKTWVKVADANVHQFGEHVCSHLILEAIAIALMRNLPSCHPLYKLLAPHLRDVITANTIYRKLLLPKEGGTLTETMALGTKAGHMTYIRKTFELFRYRNWNVANHFNMDGTGRKETLPQYHFRDDALRLWHAIQDYVSSVLAVFYKSANEVERDEDIRATLADLSRNGFYDRGGWPACFGDVNELALFATSVMFQCTVYNAATLTGVFDYYGFVPNGPPCMMQPFPKAKSEQGWTEDQFKAMLPPPEINEKYVGLNMLLSRPSQSPDTLGHVTEQLFCEEAVHVATRKFQKVLQDLSADITQRNDVLECPYEYLLPENIPAKLDM